MNISINDRIIGEGYPTYIIAEMSGNHGGSIDRAKEIIYKAKECGADCIKIQTYTADTMTIDCNNEYFTIADGTWKGKNLYKLYEDAGTPWEWQAELKSVAKKIGIDFFSTPFDKTSVDFLESLDVEFYKIASFELIDIPLIQYVASKGKPIIMSTGMGTLDEIWEAVEAIRNQGNDQIALLKCSSAYPVVPDDMNLMTIGNMKDIFGVPVGLSDHSMGSVGAVAATALGANIIEKHFCLTREVQTADSSFSMEPEEFQNMVKDIRSAEQAIGKVHYGPTKQDKHNVDYRRSIFVVKDILKGEILTEDNIRIIRPGFGIYPKHYNDMLGQIARIDIKRGTPLNFNMIGR